MYLFKHILTQEVTYETLSFATRGMLHDQIGQYIENTYPGVLDQFIDLLAFHFERSENLPKKREYLLKAAEAAQANYANAAAITYYQRVLHLLPEDERVGRLLKLGQVLELVGEWENAEQINREAERLAIQLNDAPRHARAQRALGWLLRKQGSYTEAEEWLIRARASYQQLRSEEHTSELQSRQYLVCRLLLEKKKKKKKDKS